MKTIREWPTLHVYMLLGALLLTAGNVTANTNDVIVRIGAAAPASLLVNTGQTVVILLTNMPTFPSPPDLGPVYQWFQNDYPIDSATNSSYTIYNTSMADAASYYAFVNGKVGTAQSAPLNLGVYYQYTTNSNGGALAYPTTTPPFINVSQQIICSTKSFGYYYVLPNLFYGSGVTSQSGPFTNTSNMYLDISTCVSTNGPTMDTAILLKENVYNGNVVGCCDDAGSQTCPGDPSSSMFTATLSASMSYRFTLLYRKASLGSATNVTFTWYYHN
jgi:hypothetical protein